MRILLLGCGGVGASVARLVVSRNQMMEFIVADRNAALARELAAELGGKVQALVLDVHDMQQLDAALSGVNLVFNSAGPFYKNAKAVIDSAIRCGVDYIDINDDHDVAEQLFLDPQVDRRAREAGIKLVIGCGSTPGLTNVIARSLANGLDQPSTVSLATVVPFSPALFSRAVLDHMFHISSGEVLQFIDGKYRMVPGWSGRQEVNFSAPFGCFPVFYIGHGETVTLPYFIKGLKEVRNRLGFIPEAASDLWRSLIDFGFGQDKPLKGLDVSPLQFLSHYLTTPEGAAHLSVPLDGVPWGAAFRVEVSGRRGNDEVKSVLELHHMLPSDAESGVNGDPTPLCAWLVVQAWIEGGIRGEGLLAPEACLDPDEYLRAFSKVSGARFLQRETIVSQNVYGADDVGCVSSH